MSTLALNRRASFDYEILETIEAGLELYGFEAKAIQNGHAQIGGAHVLIRNNEAWLLNAYIQPYQPANTPSGYDESRTRKLLLKKDEIRHLIGKTKEKGLTIVPLKLYSKGRTVKVQIGIGKRKKKVDKREMIKKREAKKRIERTLKA